MGTFAMPIHSLISGRYRLCKIYKEHVGSIQWTHRDVGFPLSVYLIKSECICKFVRIRGPLVPTNADLKIYKNLCLLIKVICRDGFALQEYLLFELWAPEIFEMFVYEHTETIEYVKK